MVLRPGRNTVPASGHREAGVGSAVAFQIPGGSPCSRRLGTRGQQAPRRAGASGDPSRGAQGACVRGQNGHRAARERCALPTVRPHQESRSSRAGRISASESRTVPSSSWSAPLAVPSGRPGAATPHTAPWGSSSAPFSAAHRLVFESLEHKGRGAALVLLKESTWQYLLYNKI